MGVLFQNEARLKSFLAWLHFYQYRCEFNVNKIKK